jgi:hypothetical protein
MKRRKPQPLVTGPKFVPCEYCRDGWVQVWERRHGVSHLVPAMKRCACWEKHAAERRGESEQG